MVNTKNEREISIYILDGHSLAYRAFFALPLELQTKSGMHTNAVLGFTNMLLRLIQERKPEYIAVAFDYPGPTFRHRQFEQYKATREKTPEELREQIPVIKEVIQGFNIPIYEMEGYEADDIIGTFASKGEQAGMRVIMVTADADVYQLLSPKVKTLITRKGLSELEEYNTDRLQEKYGLTPAQWVDFKALKGDSSDNVPGVPGIGEKRAVQLLKQYGFLEQLIEHMNEIPGKIGKSLAENTEQAFLSRDLVRIKTDVPVQFQFEDCLYYSPDWRKLYQLFTRLEFKNIIEKIPELSSINKKNKKEEKDTSQLNNNGNSLIQSNLLEGSSEQDSSEKAAGEHQISQPLLPFHEGSCSLHSTVYVETVEELDLCIDALGSFQALSLLADEGSLKKQKELRGIAISLENEDNYYIRFNNSDLTVQVFINAFQPIFNDTEKVLITHDLKIFARHLLRFNKKTACGWFDTLLAAYLVDPDRPSYALTLLTEEYLGLSLPEPEKKKDEKTKQEQQVRFITRGSQYILLLKDILENNLQLRQLEDLYYGLELPLVRVLAKMELNGVRVQESVLDKIGKEIDKNMANLEEEIYTLAGNRFNLNSPKQLSFVLFEKLNLPAVKKIKTGYSTDAQVLEELAKSYPIAAKLLQYRTLSKIKNTYLEGLKPLIDPQTGKIHTTFNQAVTATGRLSSKDPNLQNIPVKFEEGRRLRQAFTPSAEGNILLAADYSQIELRIMAHLSKDPNLLDAFNRNQDIHTRTASEVFNVPMEQVTPLMRSRAKAVNFGIIYGISDYGLSQDLRIPRVEAREYIESYFFRYPGVKNFIDECIKTAREKGYVTTVMNRRRYLADINHRHHSRRSFAERMARNTPVQGSAADIIKAAMITIDEKLEVTGCEASMLLQVHDELIFELPPEKLKEVAAMIQGEMENVYPLSVPLMVELKIGKDWYHMYPLERM